MRINLKAYALGAIAGVVAAGGLVTLAFLPQALAEDGAVPVLPQLIKPAPAGRAIDPDSLVRYGETTYSVTYEDWVDTTPTDRVTIRKIAFGKTSLVTVTQTDSAVFSSEAMFSPHVRYPGVHVSRVPDESAQGFAAYWSEKGAWVATNAFSAGSFVAVPPSRLGGGALITPERTCTFGKTFATC